MQNFPKKSFNHDGSEETSTIGVNQQNMGPYESITNQYVGSKPLPLDFFKRLDTRIASHKRNIENRLK